MELMFVKMCRTSKKVPSVTGYVMTHCLYEVGMVSLKDVDYWKYSKMKGDYSVNTLNEIQGLKL